MTMTYPTVEQVNDAGINAVLRWNRFLPSPRNDGEAAVINAVVERLAKLKAEDPPLRSLPRRRSGGGENIEIPDHLFANAEKVIADLKVTSSKADICAEVQAP